MSNQNDNTQNMSGSFVVDLDLKDVTPSVEEEELKFMKITNADVEKVMEDLLSTEFFDKGLQEYSKEPNYILRCPDKHVWLYSVNKHTFFKINDMTTITFVDVIDDNKSHCMINNDLYEVSNDFIECVGWN